MEQSKLRKILSLSALIGIFVIVAVLVFALFGIIEISLTVIEILGVIAIPCIAFILALPWIDRLGQKEYKKSVSNAFIIIIGVCMLLWMVCWLFTMNYIRNDKDLNTGLFDLIRLSLVLTILFLAASTISYVAMKYKKSMIAFQVITYLSHAYVSFYFIYLIICARYINNKFDWEGNEFIVSKLMIAILVIALLYVLISNAVVKSHEKRRIQNMAYNYGVPPQYQQPMYMQPNMQQPMQPPMQPNMQVPFFPPVQKTTADRLRDELTDLLNVGLLTKEEYDSKMDRVSKEF